MKSQDVVRARSGMACTPFRVNVYRGVISKLKRARGIVVVGRVSHKGSEQKVMGCCVAEGDER